MSVIASDGNPYPALCPWFSAMTVDFGHRSRITIEHNNMRDFFDVDTHELTTQFACVFNRALKIKHAMVTAEKVADALADDATPGAVRDERAP